MVLNLDLEKREMSTTWNSLRAISTPQCIVIVRYVIQEDRIGKNIIDLKKKFDLLDLKHCNKWKIYFEH